MPDREDRIRTIALPILCAIAGFACAGSPSLPPDGGAQPAAASGPAQADAQVRAMSFNIRYGTANDGDNAWPLRRDLVLRVIRDFEPTVLGLQEALRFQLDEIGAAFPEFGEVGAGRVDGIEAGEYSAILYDRRRLELLGSATFWLSDTPEVVGSMSWGNRITRIVTWARFRNRVNDMAFYVFNTHWDHESQPSRERSAELLMERIAARGVASRVLVMGDFNAGEDNPAFRRLIAADTANGAEAVPLADTFRTLQQEATDVGTFNGFTGERTGDKIDAVLVSPGWKVLEAEIVRFNEDGRYPSDHFPVTAVVVGPRSVVHRPAESLDAMEAEAHVGDVATVCGFVASTRYVTSGRWSTYLDLGRAFPDQGLTVWIRGVNRARFVERPEWVYRNKVICATGRIERDQGKPVIIVRQPDELWVVDY